MKKVCVLGLYLALFSIFNSHCFAQDNSKAHANKNMNGNQLKTMVVYPGCEEFEGNNKNLLNCFYQKLTVKVIQYLDTKNLKSAEPIARFAALVEFEVNNEGELTNIKAKEGYGNEVFMPHAENAVIAMSNYLKRNGLKIKPAIYENGASKFFKVRLPIIFTNPDYENSDWILYYYNKGYTQPKEIVDLLNKRAIFEFKEADVTKILNEKLSINSQHKN